MGDPSASADRARSSVRRHRSAARASGGAEPTDQLATGLAAGFHLLRLYLAAAGSRLAIRGTPDALVVGPERDFGGTLEPDAWPMAEAAGFVRLKDIAGFAVSCTTSSQSCLPLMRSRLTLPSSLNRSSMPSTNGSPRSRPPRRSSPSYARLTSSMSPVARIARAIS